MSIIIPKHSNRTHSASAGEANNELLEKVAWQKYVPEDLIERGSAHVANEEQGFPRLGANGIPKFDREECERRTEEMIERAALGGWHASEARLQPVEPGVPLPSRFNMGSDVWWETEYINRRCTETWNGVEVLQEGCVSWIPCSVCRALVRCRVGVQKKRSMYVEVLRWKLQG